MSWAALLGGFVGAVIGSLLGLMVPIWFALRKALAQKTVPAASSTPTAPPESGLRLVKPDTDEQPGSAS